MIEEVRFRENRRRNNFESMRIMGDAVCDAERREKYEMQKRTKAKT